MANHADPTPKRDKIFKPNNAHLMPQDPKPTKSFASIVGSQANKLEIALKEIVSYKGEPLIQFSMEDVALLSEPFKYTIVGKFSHAKLILKLLRSSLVNWGYYWIMGCETYFNSMFSRREFSENLV